MARTTKRGRTGGSPGSGGYTFQEEAIAWVSVHLLRQKPLNWLAKPYSDVPVLIQSESGGPGDDIRISLANSESYIEAQVKRGLENDARYKEAMSSLIAGVKNDDKLHGVLIVDSTSSKTIRRELTNDLKRMNQGRLDALHKISEQLIELILDHGGSVDLVRRLHVIEIDTERSASPGKQGIVDLLAVALQEPEAADDAWDILCRDAQNNTNQRGQRDQNYLTALLQSRPRPIGLKRVGAILDIEAYRNWLVGRTKFIRIPGLDQVIPITEAWAKLKVRSWDVTQVSTSLTDYVANYQSRAHVSYDRNEADALAQAEVSQHLVVVGGPGSGKSTLCRRLAHSQAAAGKRVLWIDLPSVSRRMNHGRTVGEAVLDIALSGSSKATEAVRGALDAPDWLIADGLVFDTLVWPTSIIGNGPPVIASAVTTLQEVSRWGRWDASEEGHGGAVRGDPTGV